MKKKTEQESEMLKDVLTSSKALSEKDKEASQTDAQSKEDALLGMEADKMDIEADIYKKIKQLEYENKTMKEFIEKERQAQQMEKTMAQWIKDGEFLKENYPDFDLEAEAENPAFLKLLKGGADLRGAYLAMHHDEIIKTLVEKAAREAKEEALQSLMARDMRPSENGMSAKSAALFKTDVSKLTPKQRAEIAKRVSLGETISF